MLDELEKTGKISKGTMKHLVDTYGSIEQMIRDPDLKKIHQFQG